MEHDVPARPSAIRRALSGGVLLAFGAAMLGIGWDYPVGRLIQMGPGFMPRAIGLLICLLATAILWLDLSDGSAERAERLHWRGLIFVSAGILLFAGLVDAAGLVPAIFLGVAAAMPADPESRPLPILLYSALAALGGWVLFLVVLELPIPAFWR